MLDFDYSDRKRELEAGAFLIMVAVLGFLALFSFAVVMLTRWWIGA